MYSVEYAGLRNITLTIEGEVLMSKDHLFWPHTSNKYVALLSIDDVEGLIIRGAGSIDGQGYMWWVREFIGMN